MVYRRNHKVVTVDHSAKQYDEHLVIGMVGIDCFDETKRAIDSIDAHVTKLTIVYVDNGSNKCDFDTFVDTYSDKCVIIANNENIGVGPAWNRIVKYAIEHDATKIVICNNDVVFRRDTFDNLIESFYSVRQEDNNCVMVTANSVTSCPDLLHRAVPDKSKSPHPDFACMMIEPNTITSVGYFSEELYPAYFEDNEYHHRLILMGYTAYASGYAVYCHIRSRTRSTHPDIISHQCWLTNREKFKQLMDIRDGDQPHIEESVDQRHSEEKYAAYCKVQPTHLHPDHHTVLEWWRKNKETNNGM